MINDIKNLKIGKENRFIKKKLRAETIVNLLNVKSKIANQSHNENQELSA